MMWLPYRVDSTLMLGTTGLKYQKYQALDTLKLTTEEFIHNPFSTFSCYRLWTFISIIFRCIAITSGRLLY